MSRVGRFIILQLQPVFRVLTYSVFINSNVMDGIEMTVSGHHEEELVGLI